MLIWDVCASLHISSKFISWSCYDAAWHTFSLHEFMRLENNVCNLLCIESTDDSYSPILINFYVDSISSFNSSINFALSWISWVGMERMNEVLATPCCKCLQFMRTLKLCSNWTDLQKLVVRFNNIQLCPMRTSKVWNQCDWFTSNV